MKLGHLNTEMTIIQHSIARNIARLEWIQTNLEKLLSLPNEIQFICYGTVIEFEEVSREQVLDLIKLFPGKWEKHTDSQYMVYELKLYDGAVVRISTGELPPGCQITEEEEWVEEYLIPAHAETRKRILCREVTPAVDPVDDHTW